MVSGRWVGGSVVGWSVVLIKPIQNRVDSTQMLVRAAVVLHNFLRQTNSAGYCPGGFVDSQDSTGKLKKG